MMKKSNYFMETQHEHQKTLVNLNRISPTTHVSIIFQIKIEIIILFIKLQKHASPNVFSAQLLKTLLSLTLHV